MMTPCPHSGQGKARAELGSQSTATGWCLEQSRNQLQSKVQQLEELPEAPELCGTSQRSLVHSVVHQALPGAGFPGEFRGMTPGMIAHPV